ncbi:single-stranded DNA-binding protein [Lacticaseibacillus suilingensis]|uniref:single-stranded DNA-binding protein n=1 Tax=Lacticaseibacillus suilingensis TaxID=2799577 RepID=UPI0022DEEEF6|nr:single-stranded DNA-binding protein [Lacticaseibacillus suilingensis]
MINSLALTGRLTRDVDLRYTQSGTAVGTFTLAVDRQYKRDGEPTADFINCVIWRKSAENLANFTHKGSLIGVEGHIQTRNYDNNQGQRVFVTEVVVENFALLEPKSSQQAAPAPQQPQAASHQAGGTTYQAQAQLAQTAPQTSNDPFASNGKQLDISDDDLPF